MTSDSALTGQTHPPQFREAMENTPPFCGEWMIPLTQTLIGGYVDCYPQFGQFGTPSFEYVRFSTDWMN
jgi:hypothetical protein